MLPLHVPWLRRVFCSNRFLYPKTLNTGRERYCITDSHADSLLYFPLSFPGGTVIILFYLNVFILIIRFELKKISDLTEEDLEEANDDAEHELTEVSEEQKEEVENADQNVAKIQHTGTVRSITASKILRANLAC